MTIAEERIIQECVEKLISGFISPYKIHYFCDRDNLGYELDAHDIHLDCLFCGGELRSREKHSPPVANYIGGSEACYSYAGRIQVRGDVDREFGIEVHRFLPESSIWPSESLGKNFTAAFRGVE